MTQVELEVSRFFEAPTVAEVAHHLERLIHAGQASRPSSAIVRVPRENGVVPASIAQERLWKLQHALPDIPFFNVLYALRLTSPMRRGGPGAEHQRDRATPRNSAHDLRRRRRSNTCRSLRRS